MSGFDTKQNAKNRVQIPPAPPNKPLIFPVKIRGFSLGAEKWSNRFFTGAQPTERKPKRSVQELKELHLPVAELQRFSSGVRS